MECVRLCRRGGDVRKSEPGGEKEQEQREEGSYRSRHGGCRLYSSPGSRSLSTAGNSGSSPLDGWESSPALV